MKRDPRTLALGAMVRINDDAAIACVLDTLQANGGNVTATAKALGVSEGTLFYWKKQNARLRRGFEEHALGRAGAAAIAAESRRVTSPKPSKKAKRRR